MMQRADFGICNLTPFRGASADAGTVFELGLMVGFGKRVLAYTNDSSDYVRRVAGVLAPDGEGVLRDEAHLMVEDFGNFDNLMLEWSVRESCGHPIVRHGAGAADLFRELTGFEACLRLAAADTSM
jgi:nucleoside 2-deoxyribosyltransferase